MNSPFQIGTDYYPEHWPRERWAVDAQLMRELGIETDDEVEVTFPAGA